LKETIYIFSSGKLSRKDNTLFVEKDDGTKKFLPVEHVKEIFSFGEITFNTAALNFLSQKNIIFHYFNYYGYYAGSFYPREHYNSGFMILRQSQAYSDDEKRLCLAKSFIEGAGANVLKILKYYNRREKDVSGGISEIEHLLESISSQRSVGEAMAIEGQIKQTYYQAFNTIIDNPEFKFSQRTRRPPKDYINALISFANSIIYTAVLSEIYMTHLDPRIGFLHSTNFRRFSLNLDVAEIFKPVIGDRTIFSVLNRKIITEKDFDSSLNGITLNNSGRRKFLEQLEERMKQTIKHTSLKKEVSYRRLIRIELYKLEKHLMEEKEYKPFVMDW
jgi:CRISP-associated protein Cas1